MSDIIRTASQADPAPAPAVAAFATVSTALLEATPLPALPEPRPSALAPELLYSFELFALLAVPAAPDSNDAFGFT